MEGWIKLHRKLQDNPLWFSEKFTRGQAWVDLILLANHEDSYFYKRGVKIDVKRGQSGRSEVELSDRWKWSRSKVRKFLNDLEKEQQIKQHKTNVTQLITIINYDIYQKKDTKRTPKEHQKDTYKNDKNVNNKKELLFKSEIFEFKSRYSDKMLNDFFDYWSEWNKSNTMMKFEMQKTWDLNRRLKRWANNDFNSNSNGKSKEPIINPDQHKRL